jgi:O-antigen ligase
LTSSPVTGRPYTAPPSWTPPQQKTASRQQPGFYVVLAFIFITYTRLPEILPQIVGHGVRLGLITTILAVLMVLISGGIIRIFTSKIVVALMAFTAWLILCVPLSVWRGGSFLQMVAWLVSLVSLILLAGCIDGLQQCRKAMYAMAASVLTIEALSFFLGSSDNAEATGRLAFLFGTFANANDLATLLLIGLPFCLLVVRTTKGASPLRVACMAGLFLIPITVVRTGSRGGLLALVVMFALYFFSAPAFQKIPLALAALFLTLASLVVTSGNTLVRYKTIFLTSDQAYFGNEVVQSAALSTRSRKELFLSSLRITAEHPFTGVGPGMFQVADAKDAEERKHPAAWHQTHNTFTQISSEEGVPALIFYCLALAFCFSAARTASRFAGQHPELQYLGAMAFSVRLSLIAFAITGLFASNAYQFYFPIVAGLCAALERSMRTDTHATQPTAQNLPSSGFQYR